MRPALRTMALAWSALGAVLLASALFNALSPPRDDLGLAMIAILGLLAGLLIAAAAMVAGAAMGVHALVTRPAARTRVAVAATTATVLACAALAFFLVRFTSR